VLPTFEKNVISSWHYWKIHMAIANLAKSFCTDLGSLSRNAHTQCVIFQILCEINFGHFKPQRCHFAHLSSSAEFLDFLDIFNCEISKESKFKASKIEKMTVFHSEISQN